MNEHSRKAKNRLVGSGHRSIIVSNGLLSNTNRRDSRTGRFINVRARSASGESLQGQLYIGPSDEGTVDVRYVEAVGGKVSERKPSFIR